MAPAIDQSPAEKYFGLTARPFSLTPDLRFAYHSRSHTHALEQVTAALRRREGLIVVTGAIGTGKTMLCRTLLETFESRTFLSLVLDPGLGVEDLLRKVLADFGIINRAEGTETGPLSDVTRHQYVTALQQFLASLIPLQAHAVIMVDEAQHLSPRVLEEIRLLSNFETDEAKLLQIVLVGQPDLDDLLRRPDMQQLNQRVARRCQLHPLSATEVADYIERRLTVAASPDGGDAPPPPDSSLLVGFTPAAAKSVADISAGIPRLVNTLCDRALDVAYERQVRAIDPGIVAEAAERLRLDIPGSVPIVPGRRVPRAAMAAAAVALLAAGTWWWTRTPDDAVAPPSTQSAPRLPAGGAAATAPPPAPVAPPPANAESPPPAAAEPSAPSTDTAVLTPPPGSFQIAVASFRTERRAQEVAEEVAALAVPATVRGDASGTWHRVVAGPFSTREAADSARDTLTRAGFADARVSQVP